MNALVEKTVLDLLGDKWVGRMGWGKVDARLARELMLYHSLAI